MRGERGADHVDGIRCVLHSQRDLEFGIGPNQIAHNTGGSLCCEDQVHAETASALRDVDQRVDEVRQLGSERRKLVDNNQEPR